MKVNRQNLQEEYNTTADWLSSFSKGLNKNADFLSNIKQMIESRERKFSTIDEKMADIKKRVGFENLSEKNLKTSSVQNKTAGDCGCGCKGAPGGCGGKPEEVSADESVMQNVMDYIISYISQKPLEELNRGSIVHHCRDHPKLGFRELEHKINPEKFTLFIDQALDGKKESKKSTERVEYVPRDESADIAGSDIPEFMEHSIPTS